MPLVRRYKVTQTREVMVESNNAANAGRLANCAFEKGQTSAGKLYSDISPEGIWGDTVSKIEVKSILTEEVR